MRIKPVFPWPIAVAWTLLLGIVEYVSIRADGLPHVLWLSHLTFIASVVAMWTGHRLLASLVAVGVGIPEIAWVLDFLPGLVLGESVTGSTGYMFDPDRPFYLRLWSGTFHILLPIVIIALIWRLGYDRRALWMQTLIVWVVFPLSWLFGPQPNINWTWRLGSKALELSPGTYLLLWMLIYPVIVHLPGHLLLCWWQRRRADRTDDTGVARL